MTRFADRMASIAPSPTLALSARAQALASQGIPVVNFGIGEPDFATPGPIVQAAVQAVQQGATKYGPVAGLPKLREAIAQHLQTAHRVTYTAKEIIVTCGAKQALYALMQILVNPGDEVIVPAPYWVSYLDQIRLCGGTPRVITATAESGFKITPAQLDATLTKKTKAIILNSPSNPSGAVYSRAELAALLAVCRDHACWIISDEIYDALVYPPAEFCSVAAAAPELRDRIILVNGLSKSYAMTGWRLGWVAAVPAVIEQLATWQGQVVSHATTFAQHGAVAAYTGSQTPVVQMRAAFQERRDLMVGLLQKMPGVECLTPDGAFYAFPNVESMLTRNPQIATTVQLSDYVLHQAQVAVVPGEAFGLPGYLRLSYALGHEQIATGLARMQQALEQL